MEVVKSSDGNSGDSNRNSDKNSNSEKQQSKVVIKSNNKIIIKLVKGKQFQILIIYFL